MRYQGAKRKSYSALLLPSLLVTMIAAEREAHGQIYLHNAGDAAAIAKARDSLGESRTAYLSAIDANNRVVADLIAAERTAAFNALLARRDQQLASVIDLRSEAQPGPAISLLSGYTGARRSEIAEGSGWSQQQARTLEVRLRSLTAIRRDLSDAIAQRDNMIVRFRQLGGRRGRPCDDQGGNELVPPADTPSDAMQHFRLAQRFCESIRFQREQERRVYFDLPPALTAAFGGTPDPASLPAGELRRAIEQRQSLAALVETQDRLARAVREHLEKTERYLACQQRWASQPGIQNQVNEATRRLADFLKWLQEDLATELAAPPATPSTSAEPAVPLQPCISPGEPPIAPPPRVTSVEQLEEATTPSPQQTAGGDRLRLVDIQRLIQGAAQFAPTRSLVAGAQEQVQEFRESVAGRILTGLASPDLNDPEQREATIASNILRILQAAQNLQVERRPNVSGVLIDVAAARLRSETARIEAERLKQLAALAALRVNALSQELLLLARTEAELANGGTSDLDRALRLYGRSWTEFRAPDTILQVDMSNLEYASWANRERATAEATYAMLEPALNELNEYGEGGVTPGDVARILSTIGIGALNVEN